MATVGPMAASRGVIPIDLAGDANGTGRPSIRRRYCNISVMHSCVWAPHTT